MCNITRAEMQIFDTIVARTGVIYIILESLSIGLERHPRKKWHYAENYAQNLNIVFKVITQYNIKAPRTLNLPFHSHHLLKQVKLTKNKRLTELQNISLIWIKFPQCR